MPETDPGTGGTPGSQDGGGASQEVVLKADNWGEFLGDLKGDPAFKPYEGKPVTEVFKGYANAVKLIGGDKLVIPAGKLDTDENWNQVFDKLGRPKDVSGYKLEIPSDIKVPEGAKLNQALEDGYKAVCHKEGILPKQAQALYSWITKYAAETVTQTQAADDKAFKEATETLQRELRTKEAFDAHVGVSNKVISLYAGSQETASRIIDKYGNDPDVIRLLGNVGKAMDEDSLVHGGKRFADVDSAAEKLADIKNNKANPLNEAYFNKSHNRHQYAVDEVYRLTQLVHGDEPIRV